MYQEIAQGLLHFISKSPTSFHAAEGIKKALLYAGFEELPEDTSWTVKKGGRYVVTRNGSALMAFTIPENGADKFHIFASHSDSPTFKIKEHPEMTEGPYVKLNVEGYGGMIMSTWLDRPLSVAGRIICKEEGKLVTHLVAVDKDLLVIPSLAIHMNRAVNEGYAWNIQKDLLPLYGMSGAKGTFMKTVAEAAGVDEKTILGHDLFLYSRIPGSVWGAEKEFISSGRLDDLQCAFGSFRGFYEGKKENSIAIYALFDNEEVGSTTKQGAASTFLYNVITRLTAALGLSYDDTMAMLARSFMISGDNGHALHPNYPEVTDPTNRPVLNGGIVIKFNSRQKYCTDGYSAAFFRSLCQDADVPTQDFVNRSNILGGSTLGNISNTQVALPTVDIGLPQLAMHSSWETAGVKDTEYLVKAAARFFD